MTYSRYNNLVMETHPKRTKIRGNIYFWGSYFELEEEEKWGQIYPTFEVKRGPQDQVTILSNGAPDLNVGGTRPIANFHPKWLAGVQNSLTLHNFTLHFLIDIRQGGSLFSMTRQMMASAGVSEETLEGRKGGLIYGVNFFPEERAVLEDGSINNIEIDAETFWSLVGGCCAPVNEYFVQDASNIRLRELVLSYRAPVEHSNLIKALRFSLVGRNLFFFTNKAGIIDPEVFVGTGMESEGLEGFAPPTARSVGVSVAVEF